MMETLFLAEDLNALETRAKEAVIETRRDKDSLRVRCSDATFDYLSRPRVEVVLPILCFCAQREFPHELSVHWQLRVESYARDRRYLWPWSLMLSERGEPSTEGMPHA